MKGAPGRVSKDRAWRKGRQKLCHAAPTPAQSSCQVPHAARLRLSDTDHMAGWGARGAGSCGDTFAPHVLGEGSVQSWRGKNRTHFSAAAILRVIKFINCVY